MHLNDYLCAQLPCGYAASDSAVVPVLVAVAGGVLYPSPLNRGIVGLSARPAVIEDRSSTTVS